MQSQWWNLSSIHCRFSWRLFSVITMHLLFVLALFFFTGIFSQNKTRQNFSVKNQTHHVFGFQSGNQNERHLGIAGSNGDDENFDMKPPFGFPFVINGPKFLDFPSAFWAAQKEIAEFASQLPSPGEHKELEENTIVLEDFAFQGQLINEKISSETQQDILRLRGGGRKTEKKSPVGQTEVASSSCSCGGACNCHMLESSDEEYDTPWDQEEESDIDEFSSDEDEISDGYQSNEDSHMLAEDENKTLSSIHDGSSYDEDHRQEYVVDNPVEHRDKAHEAKKCATKSTKMKEGRVSLSNIQQELKTVRCCKVNCVSTVLKLPEILHARRDFQDMNREEQVQWLLNFFQLGQRVRNGRKTYEHSLQGKVICQKAWIFCHGMSYGRYHKWRDAYSRLGLTSAVHARTGVISKSKRLIEAELWFEELVTNLANRMPDVDRLELPACLTIRKIHAMYREALSDKRPTPLSMSQFRRMWKQDFPRVIIPKTNRFTKCGVCLLINEHLRATRNKEKRLSWSEKKQLHMEQQAGERKKYYKHQKKAEKRPDKYMSIIIDGMDQAKTHLPHWIQASKLEGEYEHFMKTHLTGVLNHGLNLATCFLDFLRWPQDSNPTINCIITHLQYLKAKRRRIPPTLFLQLDNCYRDCKNIHVLGFCALLVKAGVFKKVRLSYLMVGHTHEDIDQMFSRISIALKKSNAVTLDDLVRVIQESFTPSPVVTKVDNIYDVKSWQRPYIATFKYHSHPHAFRFKLNDQGEVEMSYRNWANSNRKEWLPKEGPFIIMRELPPGKPSLLRPDLKKCPSVENIRDAIAKLKVRMSVSEVEWWEKMANEEEKRVELWNSLSDEQYLEAGQSFHFFDMKYEEPDPETEENGEEYKKREEELERLLKKKNNQLEVQMTKQAGTSKKKKHSEKKKKRTK